MAGETKCQQEALKIHCEHWYLKRKLHHLIDRYTMRFTGHWCYSRSRRFDCRWSGCRRDGFKEEIDIVRLSFQQRQADRP